MSTPPPLPPENSIEESERRVKRGCGLVFIMLFSATAVFAVEYGMTNITTMIFAVLLILCGVMLAVLFRPQKKS